MESIFIASGVTSSLFASCFLALKELYTIYAIRSRNPHSVAQLFLEQNGVIFVNEIDDLPKPPLCIFWLSTHDDAALLAKYVSIAPTLAISSGAIMAHLMGNQPEESLNAYQRSKLSVLRVQGLTVFIPGFFIEDMEVPEWASRGLHGDTTVKLFSKSWSAEFDWFKCYSVTPKTYIVKAIISWTKTREIGKHFCVCSDREYYRFELRFYANLRLIGLGNSDVLPQLLPIYAGMEHILYNIEDKDVVNACQDAEGLINKD